VKRLVVTIDGPAGSGKSTTAKLVAARLGYTYLDTGAMYRAMALKALELRVDLSSPGDLGRMASETDVRVRPDPQGTRVVMDGRDVTDLLRSPEVTRASSPVSAAKAVRERMVAIQRQIGREGGVVAEGRDIGSVVFPGADVKIYLDADLRRRAARRRIDLEAAGRSAALDEVERDLRARDQYDSSREHSPLCVPEGSIRVDTTDLTIDEQVERVVAAVRRKLEEASGADSL